MQIAIRQARFAGLSYIEGATLPVAPHDRQVQFDPSGRD
jgi:hypothetical protein